MAAKNWTEAAKKFEGKLSPESPEVNGKIKRVSVCPEKKMDKKRK